MDTSKLLTPYDTFTQWSKKKPEGSIKCAKFLNGDYELKVNEGPIWYRIEHVKRSPSKKAIDHFIPYDKNDEIKIFQIKKRIRRTTFTVDTSL